MQHFSGPHKNNFSEKLERVFEDSEGQGGSFLVILSWGSGLLHS